MWVLTLIIGLIVGWYGSQLFELLQKILSGLKDLEKAEKQKEQSGIVRPGQVTEKGKFIQLPSQPAEDSNIVRSPSPREFARQQIVDEKMDRKI